MRKRSRGLAQGGAVSVFLVVSLLLPVSGLAQAQMAGTFPAQPYRSLQLNYAIQGVQFVGNCVDGGGGNGAPTNPLRTCTGKITASRIDMDIAGEATEKDRDFGMNVDVEFTFPDEGMHSGSTYNRLTLQRGRGPVILPFRGGIDVPPEATAAQIRIFLFEPGVLHGVMLLANLQTSAEPQVTVTYRLGYDVPINLMDDAPQATPPLTFTFTSDTPAAPIKTIWLDSQAAGNPAVEQALGSRFLFDSSARADFPKRYDVDPPETQVVWPLDSVNLWALPPNALPLEVAFGARVELTTGVIVPVRVTVRIDAAYTLDVLKEPSLPTTAQPGQQPCETRTLLDGQPLPLRTTLKGQADQVVRLPTGGALLVRFLDGTAGVFALQPGSAVCYTEFGLGFSGRGLEEPTNELVTKIGLDQLKDQAQNRAQDVVLKMLFRRASGPIGLVIDIVDRLQASPAGGQFLSVRLRSAVGIAITGQGAATVQSFEGEPAIEQTDGQVLPLAPGQTVARDPSGQFSAAPPPEPMSSAAWLGLDQAAQSPVGPEPTRMPTVAVVPTPTPLGAATPTPPRMGTPTPLPPAPNAPARSITLFYNGNDASVLNGPPNPTVFSLAGPQTITSIMTYHWNSGRGTPTPGLIGLMDGTGKRYGPWAAVGQPGQGNVPNAYWVVRPDVTVPAGTYTILDSDNATWSYNGQTGGRGIARVEGFPASARLPAQAPAFSRVGFGATNAEGR